MSKDYENTQENKNLSKLGIINNQQIISKETNDKSKLDKRKYLH